MTSRYVHHNNEKNTPDYWFMASDEPDGPITEATSEIMLGRYFRERVRRVAVGLELGESFKFSDGNVIEREY